MNGTTFWKTISSGFSFFPCILINTPPKQTKNPRKVHWTTSTLRKIYWCHWNYVEIPNIKFIWRQSWTIVFVYVVSLSGENGYHHIVGLVINLFLDFLGLCQNKIECFHFLFLVGMRNTEALSFSLPLVLHICYVLNHTGPLFLNSDMQNRHLIAHSIFMEKKENIQLPSMFWQLFLSPKCHIFLHLS